VQLDFYSLRGDTGESIANSSRSRIVTFSEAGGEDQDSLFHNLSISMVQRETRLRRKKAEAYRGEYSDFNGYLRGAK
jgi:hypothetical protein